MTAPSPQPRSRRWSRQRVKTAGFVAIIAGTVLTVLSVLPAVLWEPLALSGYTRLALSVASAGMYILLAVASLGAYIRYTASIGRLRRAAILIMCAALTVTGISFIVRMGISVLTSRGVLAETDTLFAVFGMISTITTTVVIILFVCASVVGVIFWRISAASRLTAGLLMLAGPTFFATFILDVFPLVPRITFLLYLGFVALGANLWSDARTSIGK